MKFGIPFVSRIFKKNSGYGEAGASHTRRSLKGFIATSSSPSEDIDFNNATMRQRGRMLYMSAPVATSAVNTNRTKIVGAGLHVNCMPDRKLLRMTEEEASEWAEKTEAEFDLWAKRKQNCDALGVNNFYELQRVAVKNWLMSGDVFVLLKRAEPTIFNPYTLRLHIIEADRISTPSDFAKTVPSFTEGINPDNNNKIYDGVEIDNSGRVVAFHISSTYPNQIAYNENEWTRVDAVGELTGIPNIIQIMEAERPDQYRGVTYLAPVIELMLQLRRYTESELVAALIQTYFTVWITSETGASEFPFEEVGVSGEAGEPTKVSKNESEYEMGPGAVNMLNPNEKVQFGNPNIPTAGFETFVKSICKMSGAALEIPYDVLIKEFNASYSASKGALEEAWEALKTRREGFVSDFCQPIYEAWLAEAVATGRIKAPGFFNDPLIHDAWCGARWDGPAKPSLEPVKEAKANEILVSHGWKTNAQVTRECYGGNWKDNMAVIEQENRLIAEINKKQESEGNNGETDYTESPEKPASDRRG